MANRFEHKGFTPKVTQSKSQTATQTTPTRSQSPEIVPTSTRTVVQAALTTSTAHLQQLEEGMELVSDQFADRAVAIVKSGIQTCYSKASERIAAIEVEDFFAVGEVGSMFESLALPATNVAVLPGQIDAA
jgi:hypothetical protein